MVLVEEAEREDLRRESSGEEKSLVHCREGLSLRHCSVCSFGIIETGF